MVLPVNNRFIYTLFSAIFIITGSFIAIQYAKGNFRLTRQGFIPETGLLSANSFPPGAEVLINDKLITATDDTVYLEPGEYDIKIIRDGYSPWQKRLLIERELVTQTNAQLYPTTPSLSPVTFTGASFVSPSPDGQKIIYYTASASSETRTGLYIVELGSSFFTLQRGPRQITGPIPEVEAGEAQLIWSPDSTEVMLLTENKEVMLSLDRRNELATLPDISFQRRQILSQWQEEMYIRERQFLTRFPDAVIQVATQSAKNVYLSPDKKRMVYTATESAQLAEGLVPPVPATNTQPESRTLEPGSIYIYDREEDKNFKVGEESPTATGSAKVLLANDLYRSSPLTLAASPSAFTTLQASTSAETAQNFNQYYTPLYAATFQWLADSKHLLYTQDDRIMVKEYDNTNETVLYSGPFAPYFLYPWPDGSRILMLTSFSPDSPKNLYAIELR